MQLEKADAIVLMFIETRYPVDQTKFKNNSEHTFVWNSGFNVLSIRLDTHM